MATGLESAASIISVVSLTFQLFQGCIEGYRLCKTAQNAPVDGDLLNVRLIVQQSRLESWANKAGIRPGQPPKRLDWNTIIVVLVKQEQLLRSAKVLQDKYSPSFSSSQRPRELAETQTDMAGYIGHNPSPEAVSSRTTEQPLDASQPQSPARRVSLGLRRTFTKITWAVKDKEEFETLVDNITILNNELATFLHDLEREQMAHEITVLYRALISRSTNREAVETVQQSIRDTSSSVDAAAEVKKVRLALEIDWIDGETSVCDPSFHVKHYDKHKLLTGMSSSEQDRGVQIAKWNSLTLLVEWRTIASNWFGVHRSLKNLTMLLKSAQNSAFHSLPCNGYVDVESSGKFGFVFDITDLASASGGGDMQSTSLYELLSACRFVSMAHRLRISRVLAEAVVQIHTAGWLHKGLRSENVNFITSTTTASSPLEVVASKPYLAGYGYARPDTAEGAAMTELPAADTDLYRHPDSRGPSRRSFQKRFDMYGLGCVLVELALWKPLHRVLLESDCCVHSNSPSSMTELLRKPEFIAELSHYAGPEYTKAIQLCAGIHSGPAREEEDSPSLDTETHVLEILRCCRV